MFRNRILWLAGIIGLCLVSPQMLKAQELQALVNSSLPEGLKADSIYRKARFFMQRGKFSEATNWLDAGLPLALKHNDTMVSYYYVDRGNIRYMQSQFDETILFVKKSLPWLQKHFNLINEQSAYILLAGAYNRKNNNDSALYYYRKSEDICNRYLPYRNWVTYQEMGVFFNGKGNDEEAERYFEKAYQITKTRGIRMDHGLTMFNLANFYYSRNKTKKFADLFNEQQEFVKKGKKDYSKDPNHSFLNIQWAPNATLESKTRFLKEVRDKLINEQFYINAAIVNGQIAALYEGEKKFDDAVHYIKEGIGFSEKEKNFANLLIGYKILYRLYRQMGKTDLAAETADRVFVLKDSVMRIQNMQMAMEMDARYQSERKEKEISLLNAENDIKQKEIVLLTSQKQMNLLNMMRQQELQQSLIRENELKDSLFSEQTRANQLLTSENQLKSSELVKEHQLKEALSRENLLQTAQLKNARRTKWMLAGGAALFLVLGLSIFVLYRRQRRKNELIQKQAADLEVLMKEIHHRVKNNLQIVSSLLDLQSHSITDTQAHEAVKEGKNRVQSMALIHQNLYSENNIKGIRLKEYVGNLLQTLCDSYNITNDKVKIRSNIEDLSLDVDTMIPLGLVLNELVSNSFKYAFTGNRIGQPAELQILLKQQADQLHLLVRDNGDGFPEGLDVKTNKSFGLKMIRAFAQKLKAKLEIYNDEGAVVEMHISKYKTA